MARPDAPLPSATLSSAAAVSKIQETLNESLSLARAKNDHAGGNRLSIAHLLLIIGKVLAPIVGAIVEPLLVNIAKGITWAITYSLATGEQPSIVLAGRRCPRRRWYRCLFSLY